MAVFTLNWDNTVVLASANAIAQRVSYRRKDVGGAWVTAGFTPLNDLPKSAITALSPILLENVIYEFRVQSLCTTGGPTINTNGVREQIAFLCIIPSTSTSDVAATASVNTTNLNISAVRFTLRRQSNDAIVGGPTDVVVVGNAAQTTVTGLTPFTHYYWQIELISSIEGVQVVSSDAEYLGVVCGPFNTSTGAPPSCPAPEDLEVLANTP